MKIIIGTPTDTTDFVAEVSTYMGDASLHLFAMGFLEIGEIAAERAVQNRCSIDAVIPAILYSLRHSLELYLKYVIYHLRLVSESTPVKGHKILDIFLSRKEMIVLALESENAAGFQHQDWSQRFESVVKAVDELDHTGHAVRYPADTNLIPHQSGGYAISTKHLAACFAEMREVYREFDERNC